MFTVDLIESSVREFYIEMITAASDEKQNVSGQYVICRNIWYFSV